MKLILETEYIGQLEGEIAAKTSEAERLRLRNDQLVTENKRLTDLTRMLLSSQHFSTFLDDLSANRGTIPGLPHGLPQPEPQSQPQQSAPQTSGPKDVNPNGHSQSMHRNLAMIPESPYEYEQRPSNNTWTQNNGLNYDQQVYAITSVPDEPVIDSCSLSGKSLIKPLSSYGSTKEDSPELDAVAERKSIALPDLPKVTVAESEEIGDCAAGLAEDLECYASDPAFALYTEGSQVPSFTSTIQTEIDPEDRIFGDIALDKALGRVEISLEDDSDAAGEGPSAAVVERFERLKSRMNAFGARIDAVTGGL